MTSEDEASQKLNPLEEAVASFMNTWVREVEEARSSIEPPDLLHHYTDARGLLGIVQTGTLWATAAPFLNDQTELSHSLILLRQIAQGSRQDFDVGAPNPSADEFLLQVIDNFYLLLEVYLVCFSEAPDLLSQWRAYGQGQGYAIGFRSGQLEQMAMLHRVTYNLDEQIRSLSELVRRWRELFVNANPADRNSANKRMVALSLGTALMRTIVSFKNSSFEEEHEWRLVRALPSFFPETLKFRDRAGMVVPYVEILPPSSAPQGPRGQKLLPIAEIRLGPRRDPNIAGHGVEKLLQTHGHLEVHTRHSNVPLRT